MKKADCPHGDYYALCEKCYNEWRNKMSDKAKLLQFFALEEDEQCEIVKIYNKRQRILSRVSSWESETELLRVELEDIQSECIHPLLTEERANEEDEFGRRMKSGWIIYRCPDCKYTKTEVFDA